MTGRVCEVHGEYSPTGVCRWCEKPSGADQSTITLPLLCVCKTCLRGFDAPILLTSLECPECRAATVDDMRVAGYVEPSGINAKWGESPGASALRDVAELARYIALFPAAQEYLLAQEHAALRWERVARRWWSKRVPLTWGDLLERLTRPNPLLQDAPWREPTP